MNQTDLFQLLGHTIADTFRVDEVVAEGGFGLVYKAYHLHFRAPVALKCLKIPRELSDAERGNFLEQFRSEAEIMFRLSTRLANIVRPLHVDTIESKQGNFIPLMALEWLDGKTFEEIIEERACADQPAMKLGEVIELLTPVAYALDQAHCFENDGGALAIIHRDIKPDNLFLTQMGQQRIVKILDFGISKVRKAADQLAGHYSQNEVSAPFSPAYGAPEQWVPKRYGQTGAWTDVWGFALTICEIIKGDAVIVGDSQAMMGSVLDPQRRPSPRGEGVEVSDAIENVFLKALCVDPRYRYQSIRSFWESLTAAHHLSQQGNPTPDASRSQTVPALRTQEREVGLPHMRQPTPWNAPELRQELKSSAEQGLPAMLSPAPLTLTSEKEAEDAQGAELGELFPHGPSSGNAPSPQDTLPEASHSSKPSRKEPLKIHRWITKPPQPGSEAPPIDQAEEPEDDASQSGERSRKPVPASRGKSSEESRHAPPSPGVSEREKLRNSATAPNASAKKTKI